MTLARRVVLGLLLVLGGAAVVAGGLPAAPSTDVVEAADLSQFRPGNIISDQLFYDGNAMSVAQVQTFLDVQNPRCVSSTVDGTWCLKRYLQDTYTRPADARCPGTYAGAPAETAAAIITKVGQACGISQKALLVTLQKEQSLVTASGSSLYAKRYERAMGYGCPDNTGGTCDSAYYGFFNQVYMAAWGFKGYALNPKNYVAGINNTIQYSPDPGCGSSTVFIENKATAGLYRYTPYQPNPAALAGKPDGCSATGNKNFYIYFTDWFGSTQIPGAGEVTGRYAAMGGSTGSLGAFQSSVVCGLADGGCYQPYANGAIYWSPATGARVVMGGAVRDRWASLGWEMGALGYPVGDTTCGLAAGGCFQAFEKGSLYWSQATGARMVSGAIRDKWGTAGWEGGYLGYPLTDVTAISGGQAAYGHFQGGSIYWSPSSGAHVMGGPVYDRWAAAGWESSSLGLPVTDLAVAPDKVGLFQHFQNGSIYYTPATAARVLSTPVRDAWGRSGWEQGPLGYPATDQMASPGGRGQVVQFQGGSVYWSPGTGAHVLTGAVRAAWLANGDDGGSLGLPVSDVGTTPDGRATYAHFQRGSIYATATYGTHVLPTAIRDAWAVSGWEGGWWGYPTSDVTTTPDGRAQVMTFQGGQVYSSAATGAHAVSGALLSAWQAAGGPAGPTGLPVTDVGITPDGKAHYQHFEGGSVYSTAAGGTHVLPTSIRDGWAAVGWERGWLGYPTADVSTTSDGRAQVMAFQGGQVYASATTGGHGVPAAVDIGWQATGGAAGALGLPVTDAGTTPDGKGSYQHFEGGSVYSTAATGSHPLPTAIRDAWAATGFERGPLGYPVTDPGPTVGGVGRYVHFQGGSVYWTAATGAHVLRGAVRDAWASQGWELGPLGYPTTDVKVPPDGKGLYAYFEHGAVYWSPTTGAHPLQGAVLDAWAGQGWEQGTLGYPLSDTRPVADGTRTDFQRGYITVSAATGVATVHVR